MNHCEWFARDLPAARLPARRSADLHCGWRAGWSKAVARRVL